NRPESRGPKLKGKYRIGKIVEYLAAVSSEQDLIPNAIYKYKKNLNSLINSLLRFSVAEKEGFEPPEVLPSTVFKTAAIDHSAISPFAGANIKSFFKYSISFLMFFLIVQHSQWFCHFKKRFGLALLILKKLTLLFLVNLTNKPKWMDFSKTPILILFIICAPAFSQYGKQIAFRELTVEDGLSQNSVVSIAQDTTGYMWFATQDGLNKYNGNT